eukprot:882165-Rhodomonas_salina.1
MESMSRMTVSFYDKGSGFAGTQKRDQTKLTFTTLFSSTQSSRNQQTRQRDQNFASLSKEDFARCEFQVQHRCIRMGHAAADIRAFRPRKTIEKYRPIGLPVRIQHLQGCRESPPCTSPEILCASMYGELPQVVDAEGFLLPTIGKIDDRYVVSHELGRGTFGSVLKAWDSATGQNVAIKVVKSGGKSTQDAVIEAAKLTLLGQSEVGRRFVVIAYQ